MISINASYFIEKLAFDGLVLLGQLFISLQLVLYNFSHFLVIISNYYLNMKMKINEM